MLATLNLPEGPGLESGRPRLTKHNFTLCRMVGLNEMTKRQSKPPPSPHLPKKQESHNVDAVLTMLKLAAQF
jgi:hypothetical protein